MVTDKEIYSLFGVSIIGSLFYWLWIFNSYLYSSLTDAQIPIDALIILISIICLVWGAILISVVPIYYLLKKFRKKNTFSIILISLVFSIVLERLIVNEHSLNLSASMASGILSGGLFIFLTKEKHMKTS